MANSTQIAVADTGRQQQQDGESEIEAAATESPSVTELTCPCCGSASISDTETRGESVCDDCDVVVKENKFQKEANWQSYSDAEHAVETQPGSKTTGTFNDKGLSTNIGFKDRDGYGSVLSSMKRSKMHRMREWQQTLETSEPEEKHYDFAIGEIDRMAAGIGVPRAVRNPAGAIYKRALDADLIRGRSIEGVASAVLYATCRQEGYTRSLEELASVSRVDHAEILQTYHYITNALELENQSVEATQYVAQLCSILDVSEQIKEKATEIIVKTADDELLTGDSLMGYTAAAVYAASVVCGDLLPQQRIADTAQVPRRDLRTHYQEQIESLGV